MVVYRLFPTSNHNLADIQAPHRLVVYRLFPTSNHNLTGLLIVDARLFIVCFLHQTTTDSVRSYLDTCCLSSVSYIKPQPVKKASATVRRCLSSVSYIKPQLRLPFRLRVESCLSSVSYIKPQLHYELPLAPVRCLSSVSYIKPQPHLYLRVGILVVYRLFPTSNHNNLSQRQPTRAVVYRLFPTSNHNLGVLFCCF